MIKIDKRFPAGLLIGLMGGVAIGEALDGHWPAAAFSAYLTIAACILLPQEFPLNSHNNSSRDVKR